MKFHQFAAIFFLIVLSLGAGDSPKSEVGRYQLLAATIKNQLVDEQCMFKIDTTTGHTWWFATIGDKNGNSGAWIPVYESAEEASKAMDELDELMTKGNELLKKTK